MLIISPAQIEIIYDHATQIYPEECCGILLGEIAETVKTVVEFIPTINIWNNLHSSNPEELNKTKQSRYTIDPHDIFTAQKRGRDLGLEIIGFFHSHPNSPAIPSTCDRDRAWEIYSYPIVSIINGKVSDLKSWVLDGQRIFQPEEIKYK